MMMTAISNMSHWLSGNRLPWAYRFNRTRLAYFEQYGVHLNNQLIQGQDYRNDAVADYLGVHDANNFRRSLKR